MTQLSNYDGNTFPSFFDTQYMYQNHQAALPSPPTSPQFSWQVTTVDDDAHTHTYNDALPMSKTRRTQIPAETMQSLMTGPDVDGKYICLYAGCMRRFGRKYNIQSHIQTHLADRPFRCGVCAAGFVRRHDLVRHARIHGTGKDFTCGCGKGFSRMDALNRHRQRQICIGGQPRSENPRSRKRNVGSDSSPIIGSSLDSENDSCGSSHNGSASPEPHMYMQPKERQSAHLPFGEDVSQQLSHHHRQASSRNYYMAMDLETQLQMAASVPRYTADYRQYATQPNQLDSDMWVNPSLISPAMTQASHFQSDADDLYYY